MLLYECKIPDSEKYLEKWVDHKGAQCYTPNMPLSWRTCDSAIISWAIGSEGKNQILNIQLTMKYICIKK